MDDGNMSLDQFFEQGLFWNNESTQFEKQNIIPSLQTLIEDENDGEEYYDCLDNFDFVLPSTPESLLTSGSEHEQTLILDSKNEESYFPSDVSEISSILSSQADLELTTSQTSADTLREQTNNAAIPQFIHNSQSVESVLKQKCEKSKPLEKEKDNRSICSSSSKSSFAKEVTEETEEPISKKVENIQKEIPVRNSKDKKLKSCGLLQFPPCEICSGKATGSHYGAITCEACKGFFRRHLQKKTNFKCTKGGKCDIISNKKGICSGCRLKKCLDLGMSKEKSKMGRYTLTKRTEAIVNMNIHDGKQSDNSSKKDKDSTTVENVIEPGSIHEETHFLLSYIEKNPRSFNTSHGFNDALVVELVKCLDAFELYGPNIKTKEQIKQAHKAQSDRYRQKIEVFGKLKNVSKEEYNELYLKYGIDIDGRMADMKLDCEDIESDLVRLCNFARHIPEFHCFSVQDQVSLLNTLMIDFFTVVMIDGYSDEYQTFLTKNGRGYHVEEISGREYSEKLVVLSKNVYCRLQSLDFTTEEKALIMALLLVSPDRCKLQNRAQVEKVQLSLTVLLQKHIEKSSRKGTGMARFSKIMDSLIYMRELTDQQMKENNEFCKDELYKKEFPFLGQFFIEEN